MARPLASMFFRPCSAAVILAGVVAGLPAVAITPIAGAGVAQPSADAAETDAKQLTIARMMRRITDLKLQDQTLADVLRFLQEYTGADMQPLWISDRDIAGLDPETRITLEVRDASALDVLEMILERADRAAGRDTPSTWQMSRYGSIEFGPKERLNARKSTEVYVIADFLFDVPDFDQAPQFDLNTIFAQGGQAGGGGGGQAPFQTNQQQRDPIDTVAVAEELADVLRTFAEPDEWVDNGGTGGTLRYYRGTFIVNAPDYMHRAIIGYSWWPRTGQVVRVNEGKRSLSLNAEGVDTDRIIRAHTVPANAPAIRDIRISD